MKSFEVTPENKVEVTEIDPHYGEVIRPATRIEIVVFKAKDFIRQAINSVGA